MISINPYFFDKCNVTGVALYKAIAQGNCDEFLKAAAQNVKQVSFPFFLRFAWEMNATSMAWGIQKTGSSNEDFIGAWRHMHDVFTAEGVTQAIWVFSPNAEQVADPTFNEYYPGDSYVDWVGLDGYNWGKTQTWSSWQSFETVFSSSYRKLTRIATSKPVMLAEVNTTDVGGNKAVWLQDMFATVTSSRFSQVQAIVFYNEDRSASEQVNWRLDESPIYMQTVAQALKNQVFTSSL
jgi:beta-mannanase